MLKKRIVTSTLLMAVVLSSLVFLPPVVFSLLLALALVGLGGWEWAYLCELKGGLARFFYVLCLGFCACAAPWLGLHWILIVSALWWFLACVIVFFYPRPTLGFACPSMRLIMGAFVLVPTWYGLHRLHGDFGASWVLLLFLLVWSTDIGAYFFGKRWGRHLLAPQVSPGKTWEGFGGGILAALLAGFTVSSLFSVFLGHFILYTFIIVVVAIASILGDLLESTLKRIHGSKDSGQLLPGHGGVLDRIDSLTAATPIFLLLLLVLGI